MKILSMTATFGKLENETLTFSEGLNVITAPTEWGKSTWCAFLAAMLYGIDTRERTKGDNLADKERFLPWSGRPMEGTLRIIHQGRDITIQRQSRGRVPMGDFKAWETETGLPVRELTAENCGLTLLGVEKSVFLRTGFLRFSDLPMKADDALRRRLNALVTTGDESGSAELLGSKLRELKNRCRHNHTGLIPECQSQIQKMQEQLSECRSLQQQHDALMTRLEDQQTRYDALENHRRNLEWQESQAHQQRIAEARASLRTANTLERTLTAACAENPDILSVKAKIKQAKDLLEDTELGVEAPPTTSPAVVATAIASAVILVSALLMADQGLLLPCLAMAGVMLFVCLCLHGRSRRKLLWYNIENNRRLAKRDELMKLIASWEQHLRALNELDHTRDNINHTREYLGTLEALSRQAEAPTEEDELTLSREETMQSLGEISTHLERTRHKLAQLQGRMEMLPDEEQLQRSLSQARHRLSELERTRVAIGFAQNALETAMQELQRQFAPRITRRAEFFLARLTGGAYSRIAIDDNLSILSAREGESTLRTPNWRSEGTGDQMYLALRLAVWEVLSEESPLILDDALVRFDQGRMEKAMELLTELSQNRQVLLFSCQQREKEYVSHLVNIE